MRYTGAPERTVIAYEDGSGNPVDVSAVDPLPTTASESGNLLLRILQMLMAPLGYDKSLQRYRQTSVIESGTVTTVGTVSALTSLNNIDTYNARMTVLDTNRTAWAQCVRSRIT